MIVIDTYRSWGKGEGMWCGRLLIMNDQGGRGKGVKSEERCGKRWRARRRRGSRKWPNPLGQSTPSSPSTPSHPIASPSLISLSQPQAVEFRGGGGLDWEKEKPISGFRVRAGVDQSGRFGHQSITLGLKILVLDFFFFTRMSMDNSRQSLQNL